MTHILFIAFKIEISKQFTSIIFNCQYIEQTYWVSPIHLLIIPPKNPLVFVAIKLVTSTLMDSIPLFFTKTSH